MSFDSTAIVFGIDLAWGLKSADAIAQIELSEESLHIGSLSYTHGDSPLLQHIIAQQTTAEKERVLLAIDAPLQCLNQTGSRPVDKECNTCLLYTSDAADD